MQNTKASRLSEIEIRKADQLLTIEGVKSVTPRVWGYYNFENAGVNFTLVGIDEFERQYSTLYKNIVDSQTLHSSGMIVGSGVKKMMQENYYQEYFNFIKRDGSTKRVDLIGVFNTDIQLQANDIIVMTQEDLREIFGMDDDMANDFVVEVANRDEVTTIAAKIQEILPNTRVITNDSIKLSYENIFNYKAGVFLTLFIICIFTFFIIIYDKLSGLSSEEKREVGILKAVGWRVEDVLKEKFYEALIVSLFAYILGILLSLTYVYFFNAPLLRDVFLGFSDLKPDFELSFIFDFETLFLVFLLSVPIYIAATIFPAYRVATLDADEIIR